MHMDWYFLLGSAIGSAFCGVWWRDARTALIAFAVVGIGGGLLLGWARS